ncbi:MAG: FAD-dependent oxidoreductase [Chromatiales bacterium]|jgi:3-oxosteroid 1-dehydrogenase|nr:FAD-dependent oxidoreductase [Chromatiales bacterium]
MTPKVVDIITVGSGAAALSAALTAASEGASVLILEKSDKLGGTTAMSGAGIWIPANHLARAEGIEDSPEEALEYLRATAPEGWRDDEDALWAAFTQAAPEALALIAEKTPLQFELTKEPDPMAEYAGGKDRGRMLSPGAIARSVAGPFGKHIRRSTLPHIFTYGEVQQYGPYSHPLRAGIRLLPRLVCRWLTGSRGQGNALVAGLASGCLEQGCEIELNSRVTALVQDEVGTVTGVEVERGGRQETVLARRGVVLASGGFEWDDALREQHFPGPFDRIGSPRTNTGDGQHMAVRAGAALARMDQANVFATLPTRYEGEVHGMPTPFHAAAHAILVNRAGERFVDEFDYNVGEAMDARDKASGAPAHLPCWMIADQQFMRGAGVFRWYARTIPGWIRSASSVDELSLAIDVPAPKLRDTLARYNGFVSEGQDADFHRGETAWDRYKSGATASNLAPALGSIERAPFIAVPVNRSILVTKGGPRTNADGQVLRPDGSAIGGLYCAGVAMANPIGTRSVGAGTTLGPCLTWGHICARSLLRSNR